MQKFLVKCGAKVTRHKLHFYLQIIRKYYCWSIYEWTLETGFKNFTYKNVEKARRIEDIQVSFGTTSALIRGVIILEVESARNSSKRRYTKM